ncbi:hypothetical protein PoB_006954800 [Plakobranchus ocellatus]|uniref:Uncharacterized protein n=1 Tax=Plakobranchus ocellatus TaxID=259542 RepID=A0AAV4DG45_9GAST|nr:hypothetical protein PoB_006954800 [Plakobranchus ocellatus]
MKALNDQLQLHRKSLMRQRKPNRALTGSSEAARRGKQDRISSAARATSTGGFTRILFFAHQRFVKENFIFFPLSSFPGFPSHAKLFLEVVGVHVVSL